MKPLNQGGGGGWGPVLLSEILLSKTKGIKRKRGKRTKAQATRSNGLDGVARGSWKTLWKSC